MAESSMNDNTPTAAAVPAEPEIDYFTAQYVAAKWRLDYNTFCAALRDMQRATPQPVPTPAAPGWKLVPDTATHRMLNAANAGRKKGRSSSGEIYAAMLYAAPQATPPAPGWVCPKCGTDRLKAACPQGHSAALTGQCPMVGTAASAPPAAPAPAPADARVVIAAMQAVRKAVRQYGEVGTRDVDIRDHNSRMDAAYAALSGVLDARAESGAPAPAPVLLTDALRTELVADAREVFSADVLGTPQDIRDVIEYVDSWLQVYIQKRAESGAPSPAPQPLTTFNREQVRRLWDNSPAIQPDAPSFAAFERIVHLVESAYGITGGATGGKP